MSTQPLFYKKIVPLNKKQHGELYIEPAKNFKFTKETNSIYIAAVEFPRASKEYTIVFGKGVNDTVFPVVLLGLKNKQNIYLGKKNEWLADYIPAYIRRYPYILATNNENGDNFTVCIDEGFSGLNKNKKGESLFNEKGEESEVLKKTIEFMKEYQNHVQLTNIFCNNINKLGLLEPMQAKIEKSGQKQALGGFLCISRNKLKSLTDKELIDLIKTDQMELIYSHLNSLTNIDRLIKNFG